MGIPSSIREQISQLPKTPGVYFFKGADGEVMYVGKATSLRDRVRSYWAKELNRGPGIVAMVEKVHRIDHQPVASSIEALIAEANYITKYMPRYNVRLRDDKSYFYVKLDESDESGFPRLSMVHKNEMLQDEKHIRYFGPYTSGKALRLALKTIRKIFPYRSCTVMPKKPCLQYHIKRCQAPCMGLIEKAEYKRTIRHIVAMLEGKKEYVVKQLKRQMEAAAKKQDFEGAARLRNQYLGLQHLHQMAQISDVDPELSPEAVEALKKDNIPKRIEGYDVSNLSGKEASVSMVVFLYGKPAKSLYRRFTIRTVTGPNDYAMLQEAVQRRLERAAVSKGGVEEMLNTKTWDIDARDEWQLPDVMIIDGAKGQLSAVQRILDQYQVDVPLIGIAKGPQRKREDLYFSGKTSFRDIRVIRAIRDEAHRFAGAHHRLMRTKRLLTSDLDSIPKIGPVKRKKLLQAFGSVAAIKSQSIDVLAMQVGHSSAGRIYAFFHDGYDKA